MADVRKAYDLRGKAVKGSEDKALLQWHCNSDHLSSFLVRWFYKAYGSKTWREGGSVNVTLPNKLQGWYHAEVSLPAAKAASVLMFRVKPYAKNHQVKYYDGTNRDGTAKYRTVTEAWFTGETVESAVFSSPLFDATVKRAEAEYSKGEKNDAKADGVNAEIAAIPRVGENAMKLARKYERLVELYEAAAKCYQASYDYYLAAGYTSKTNWGMSSASSRKSARTASASAADEQRGQLESDYAAYLQGLEQAKIDKRRGAAKEHAATAADAVKSAKAYAKARDHANAAKLWAQAKAAYEDSAEQWGKAYELSHASSDSSKRTEMNAKAQECEEERSEAAGTAKAAAELLEEKSSKPAAPTISVVSLGNGKNKVTMNCTAKWTDAVYLERSHDNKIWAVVHEFSRTAPKDGGNWTAREFTDTVEDGRSYWYRAASARKAVPESPRSAYSTKVAVEGRPAAPTNFMGAVTSTPGQIVLKWSANGSVGQQYEIVYTDKTGRNAKGEVVNAWAAGIPESEMHVYRVPFGQSNTTLNGMAAGPWWFRIRLTGAGGTSTWGHRHDWTKANPLFTIKLSTFEEREPKLTAPRALKATRIESSGRVTLSWADNLEDGATYTIQHSTRRLAWTKNIASDISSTNYDGSLGNKYSFTDLEKGADHYFRLLKSRGDETVTASAAEGSSMYDVRTAFVKVPAPVAETVVAPTGLTAALSGTDAIVLKWTSSQGVGESYEVQHAATSAALTANDAGLITELKLSQYTTSDAKQHTLTRLEAGGYAFRVRKVSASGTASAWSNIATATVPAQANAKLAAVTGLYARYLPTGVTEVYWSGILEEGASYEIWSSSQTRAFANNVMEAITVTPVDELASGGNTTFKYGFLSLERGKVWMFRVRKERDDEWRWARAKEGDESYMAEWTVKVNVPAEPSPSVSTPTDLEAEARNTTSVRISWSDNGAVGDKYIVQCTDDLQAYDDNAEGAITQMEMTLEQASSTHVYSITGLEPGASYAVRVRKAVGDAVGEWTDVATAELPAELEPDELAAPTVARLFSGYVDGDEVTLSWTHNSGSASAQSAAQVSLLATDEGGATVTRTVDVSGEQNALSVPYAEMGAGGGWSVEAAVRTQGSVEGAWSPWSAVQRFALYRRPALGITLTDGDGDNVGGSEPFTRFPLTVEVQATAEGGGALESTNLPVSYTFELTASREFSVTGADGSQATVAAGQRVYSARADYGDEGFSASGWTFQVGAQDMRVADGAELVATASVVTAQGLRSEPQEASFSCSLGGEIPMPLARAEYRPGTMTATITPACTLPDDSVEEDMWGVPDGFSCSATGYSATRARDEGDGTATVEVEAPDGVEVLYVGGDPVNDVDGTFPVRLPIGETVAVVAEDGEGEQAEMTMALDGVLAEEPEEEQEDAPEGGDALTPGEAEALADFAWEAVPEDEDWEGVLLPEDADGGYDDEGYELREDTVLAVYRVNADGSTVEVASGIPNDGVSGCVDPHPSFGACTYRIVATDTQTGVCSVGDVVLDVPEENVVIQWGEQWAGDDYGEFQGERLVISRNTEAGEELSPKSALADLAGREHPTAFYGRGSSQTYNASGVVVPMLEADAVGAVRRLGSYNGDVYVRDPDGFGCWANVASVRLSRARKTVGRAVSVAVTRVEGGL